jgi:hypothetical protein
MVIGLFLRGPNSLRDGEPPLLGIRKFSIHVVDHAAERMAAVPDDITNGKLCEYFFHELLSPLRVAG